MIEISAFLALGMFTLLITAVTMWIVSKRIIYPGMVALFEEKYENADKAISRAYGTMGTKSAQMKAERKFEGEAVDEILDSYPEIMAIAGQISPDLAEMIENDPLNALRMAERYLPTLSKMFPQFFEKFGATAATEKPIYEF
ncbi:unnamed protein product [marine sediment metagenome]|uniref:Uncharacterized protein n=1 Tax=marine sediment metagenome TaxID=412755 RepID=X1JJL7_9ZZZZ